MSPNCRGFLKERICFNDFFSLGSIRCNDGRHNFLPLAHRGARVIGTDALRILVISQEASGGEEGNQDNEDNPNIDAHQSRLLPPVRTRRYSEAKESPGHQVPGPQGVDHVRGSPGVKVPRTPHTILKHKSGESRSVFGATGRSGFRLPTPSEIIGARAERNRPSRVQHATRDRAGKVPCRRTGRDASSGAYTARPNEVPANACGRVADRIRRLRFDPAPATPRGPHAPIA
jgi:hypothetical protein